MPLFQQPGKQVHDLIMLGSMPRRVRDHYGLPFTRPQASAFAVATRAIRTARRFTPGPLTRGWNTGSFERVAQAEQWRIEHGKPTPQIRDA
jgi:hypothetical protein